MYIVDTSNYRVLKWLNGQPLGFVVAGGRGSGSTPDKIGVSYAVCVDDQFNVYVSEYSNHRISMWMNGNTTAGNRVFLINNIFYVSFVNHALLFSRLPVIMFAVALQRSFVIHGEYISILYTVCILLIVVIIVFNIGHKVY